MDEVIICRICLITNVRMYDLSTYPFEKYCLKDIGINLAGVVLPTSYACYECAALIKKFHFFREKCLKGQVFLLNTLRTTGEISPQSISQIDRLNMNLTSNIHIKHLNESNDYYFIYEEIIKNEPAIEKINDNEKNDNYFKYNAEIEVIKEEIPLENIISPNLYSSDDDNEPLSYHKSNKEKKERKKTEKRKSWKKKEVKPEDEDVKEECLEVSVDTSELLLPILEDTAQKKKRGRPKKADNADQKDNKDKKQRRTQNTGGVDPEDIDLEEYVTVINLSLEEQMEEVKKRQETSNYLNAPFQCNLCYRGFIDTEAWKHHVSKHDPSSGDIECPICKFRFKTNRTLQKHASNHQKKYACKSCSYVSKTTTQAKQHQRWHKGVTYKCQYCDEISTKWTSYLSHVRIKHPSEFVCDVCGYSYVSKLGLSMHRTMMHKDVPESNGSTNEAGPYCAECDVKFVSEEAYKRHMVTSVKHIKHSNFKNGCRSCGGAFSSAEELRLHHRREHARKRPRNYGKKPSALTFPTTCDHCSEEICNARQYWAHFRRAHPDKKYPIQKDYVCDVCGKSFRTKITSPGGCLRVYALGPSCCSVLGCRRIPCSTHRDYASPIYALGSWLPKNLLFDASRLLLTDLRSQFLAAEESPVRRIERLRLAEFTLWIQTPLKAAEVHLCFLELSSANSEEHIDIINGLHR
ncbi:unnamed protein product [Diatraea saccharalis]|uniref:C2H2-type domain-containing protein n=1 Tax=Diatraea saccharalis TaxID=40085 RepID=A0A9N9R796_9NEOP|nr:unnamed protein product [Diatraea saccharalis]